MCWRMAIGEITFVFVSYAELGDTFSPRKTSEGENV